MKKINYSRILLNKSNSKSTNIMVSSALDPKKKKTSEIEKLTAKIFC